MMPPEENQDILPEVNGLHGLIHLIPIDLHHASGKLKLFSQAGYHHNQLQNIRRIATSANRTMINGVSFKSITEKEKIVYFFFYQIQLSVLLVISIGGKVQ